VRLNTEIAHWVGKVAARQWLTEDTRLAAIGAAMPPVIAESPALSRVHRLDLSLFVIFEEAALRVSGALTRSAPSLDTVRFAAQQTIDEARHYEIFRNRLLDSCRVAGASEVTVGEEIMIPPLRRFINHCYEIVDRGDFVEGLTLMNLVFEGMAYPLYAHEQRYWEPLDPYLTLLIRSAFVDESRHVAYGAELVKDLLRGDPAKLARLQRMSRDATEAMTEVFDYYVRKFVKLFDIVAIQHQDLFATAEFAPGRRIAETPYAEQVAAIQQSMTAQHATLLERAGLR
jgi:hypothetical protein